MELFRALGSLIEAPVAEHRGIAEALDLPAVPDAAVHGAVVGFQRYPYASVYLGPEGMMGGEARDRVAGFVRALGITGDGAGPAGDERGPTGDARADAREPDHLASLLGLLAALDQWERDERDGARRTLLGQARVALVWEHVASWTGPYLASFDGCGNPFYEEWAALLGAALSEATGIMEFPDYLPAALRSAPVLADPRREGGPAFISALLAPARSGVIILRDDLVRLGDEVGLACRAGERRYVLNSFFAQDPAGTLRWLASHAGRWGARVGAGVQGVGGMGVVAGWWAGRARSTAALLAELADEAVAA
ncbi:MAG: molecular chaperone TorD family protein [Gemmatimonadetes bacterium]|nr:molecular chaperone TorD family protein [Gemmatimonadota bacterium]